MLASQGQFVQIDFGLVLLVFEHYLVAIQIGALAHLLLLGVGELLGLDEYLVQVSYGYLVVGVEYEAVLWA